jgi:hypothetical protein
VTAAFLVLVPLIKVSAYEITSRQIKRTSKSSISAQQGHANLSGPVRRPNIYYIILDAYARHDVLEEMYKYDNRDFLSFLKDKGFYVAEKSRSNYCQSVLSLASSLNFQYLDSLAKEVDPEISNRRPLTNLIRNNRAFQFLKQFGYVTVSFDASAWEAVQTTNVDIFFRAPGWGLSTFNSALLNTTPVAVVLEVLRTYNVISAASQYDFHRARSLYAFEKLQEISKQQGPMFVFAHILLPHQPFVFDERGEPINPKSERFALFHTPQASQDRLEYVEGYRQQVAFTNKKVEETIAKIISDSPEPPIIILQADHGPASMLNCESADDTNVKERMSILNAYYLPGAGNKELYDEISPVNTFRTIFNLYFGTNFELLKDQSYFSTWAKPYRFIEVTNTAN